MSREQGTWVPAGRGAQSTCPGKPNRWRRSVRKRFLQNLRSASVERKRLTCTHSGHAPSSPLMTHEPRTSAEVPFFPGESHGEGPDPPGLRLSPLTSPGIRLIPGLVSHLGRGRVCSPEISGALPGDTPLFCPSRCCHEGPRAWGECGAGPSGETPAPVQAKDLLLPSLIQRTLPVPTSPGSQQCPP